MLILENLRNNPMGVMQNSHIYVDVAQMERNQGGSVLITETDHEVYNYFNVQPAATSNDYYFPYIAKGVGTIQNVMPNDGAIVVTSGMNGCALEVRYSNGVYNFYHDADGSYMSTVDDSGTTVCRIEENAYWDDSYIISPQAMQYAQPAIYFICVYRNGYWHVGAFGFRFKWNPIGEDEIHSAFEPIGGRYRGRFNADTPLMQL